MKRQQSDYDRAERQFLEDFAILVVLGFCSIVAVIVLWGMGRI